MLFSYSWIKDLLKGKVPEPNKLAKLLTLHSFEVEGVKKVGNDWVFDIDVTPNRAADCFSHLGIARECVALASVKLKTQKPKLKEDQKLSVKSFIQIEVKDKNDCPRYTGRVALGVKVKPSPKYIQERLRACGLQPINNIVDAANYVMLELGQPIHAFDLDKIKSVFCTRPGLVHETGSRADRADRADRTPNELKKIIIRKAKTGESINALDDKTYKLDKDILVIADSKEPIAIAGIKGGKSTAIDNRTKNIFIESANFNPVLIRNGSKKLGLKTDASFRFEHGLDPNMTEMAVNRLATLIQDVAGGKAAKGVVDFYPKKVLAKKIQLKIEDVEGLLGLKIGRNEIIKILESLGFDVSILPTELVVKIPTWRPDLAQSEDLVEEIGRIYGYEKLTSSFPRLALLPPQRNEYVFWTDKAKNILKELGFSEVYNYSFVSKQRGDMLGGPLVELENPFSEQFYYLRPNLLINLWENIQYNIKYLKSEKTIKIFEVGKVFKKNLGKIEEKTILAGMITGAGESFYHIKGVVDSLLEGLGISDRFYDDFQATPDESGDIYWSPKKSAEIKVGGKEIGFLGELNSPALGRDGKQYDIMAFEIDFDKLIQFCSEEQEYRVISRFPAAVRDIAVLVPLSVKVADVLNIINIAGGDLVQDVDLFDIYEGEELAEGKKNLAFHIIFQAKDRTLSGKEIEKLLEEIIKALEEEPEWEVRR